MNLTDHKKKFYDQLSEIHVLHGVDALLGWDQQVYMPPKASDGRAAQIEYISLLAHRRFTEPEFMQCVDALAESLDQPSDDDRVNVREVKRALDRQRKLPDEFVAEKARASAVGYDTWVKARPSSDFEAVKPILTQIVDLARREADLIGYVEHPYDALLDAYEPYSKLSVVKPLLTGLAEKLRTMIPGIAGKYEHIDDPKGVYEESKQYAMGREIAADLGYDFQGGRLDKTAHPFMTTIGKNDVRITTRYYEDNFLPALYGVIHETGHALYELGLPADHLGTPCGEAVSMGVHESQSRLWENLIGRRRSFMVYLHRVFSKHFPDAAATMDEDRLWMHANKVKPDLIRVEADEVTYTQHIVVRMLLEEALVAGSLQVDELPGAWDDLYQKYLGLRSPTLKNGVMQDVHWFSGAIGYFPSYALGNLYNSMMMETAQNTIPDLDAQIAAGDFSQILGWLRTNVHEHGMRFTGPELIKRISGRDLESETFAQYVAEKFR
jgi:carboxypeptidase Taq